MSLQDDIFDVDEAMSNHEDKDAWERVFAFYQNAKEERDHLKEQMRILVSAGKIIKNYIKDSHEI